MFPVESNHRSALTQNVSSITVHQKSFAVDLVDRFSYFFVLHRLRSRNVSELRRFFAVFIGALFSFVVNVAIIGDDDGSFKEVDLEGFGFVAVFPEQQFLAAYFLGEAEQLRPYLFAVSFGLVQLSLQSV